MRTTVDIPDATYRVLKGRATAKGKSIEELVLRSIDQMLSERDASKPKRRLTLPLIDSDTPGSLEIDNERIYDLIGFP